MSQRVVSERIEAVIRAQVPVQAASLRVEVVVHIPKPTWTIGSIAMRP